MLKNTKIQKDKSHWEKSRSDNRFLNLKILDYFNEV